MNDKLTLNELIQIKLPDLSKSEKKIAKFFLEHRNDVAFSSIYDISKRLELGRASIMRFSQKIGYSGFMALKKDIKSELQSDLAPLERFKLKLNGDSENLSSITQIAKQEVENINHIINNFDIKSFNKAVKVLSKSEFIYTTGFNLSSFIAGLTSYLLQRVGLKSFPTNLGGRTLDEQLLNINSSDSVITFSLPPYSPETIKAAQFAKKQKAKVITFTNSLVSPIVNYSDIVLLVKTESNLFTNSFSSTLVLIYSLVNEIAISDKQRFKKTVKKFSD